MDMRGFFSFGQTFTFYLNTIYLKKIAFFRNTQNNIETTKIEVVLICLIQGRSNFVSINFTIFLFKVQGDFLGLRVK